MIRLCLLYSVCVGACVQVSTHRSVGKIEQLWPLLGGEKMISLEIKWWMANSGSHMGCVCVLRGKWEQEARGSR